MAENNAILLTGEQHSVKQAHESVTTSAVDNSALDDSVSRLHDAVDFYQLFDTFIAELRLSVSCDSIEYRNEATQTFLVNGFPAQHRCAYGLNYDELPLGEIEITRASKFQPHELEIVETLLAGLTLPLRNVLRHQQAIRFVQRDELTGLRNADYYHDVAELEIERARRYKKPFSLVMFDLDEFEDINNQYDSSTGDAILIEVARRIEQQARSSDIVYRCGGDEFLVFLPNTEKAEAIETAKRVKDFVLANTFAGGNNDIAITLSAGVVTVNNDDTANRLIYRVGKALFNAKALGKNRIYGELMSENVQPGCVS